MTDRPILFSGPMVRALLDGRKSQTRRVIKAGKYPPEFCGGRYDDKSDPEVWGWEDPDRGEWITLDQWRGYNFVPFRVGDRLWVRESCATWEGRCQEVVYRADETERGWSDLRHDSKLGALWKLRPSIHMPRWASRLTLTVTDVQVQRVRDISEADAIAEGCIGANSPPGHADDETPREQFQDLWNSLNAPRGYGWEANPWVAAYTFNVHRQNIDQMEAS